VDSASLTRAGRVAKWTLVHVSIDRVYCLAMRIFRASAATLLAGVLNAGGASAVEKPSLIGSEIATAQQSNSTNDDAPSPAENETPYLDFPIQKLRLAIPTLVGIKPDGNQDQLSAILSKVGEVIADSLSKVPSLSAREEVHSLRGNPFSGLPAGADIPDAETQLRQSRSVDFHYLIVLHHAADGTRIEEYRGDAKNHEIDPEHSTGVRAFGFAFQWLMLSSANQSDYRFRYLGQQKIDGHDTFVVAFTQVPAKVKAVGKFTSSGKSVAFYYQGIAWIDQTTSNIVLLRTDLLHRLPSVQLDRMTTEVHFRSVSIHDYPAIFWLPSEVHVTSEQGGNIEEELHLYSHYALYKAKARIVP
jgi:hypothetical protein